jgi:hypothetical protein
MLENKFKPSCSITELNNTFVNVKTKKEMKELMRIFEINDVEWLGGFGLDSQFNSLNRINYWDYYKEETCVSAYTINKTLSSGFGFNSIKDLRGHKNIKVISLKEYKVKQLITPERIEKVNNYFNSLV